MNFLILSGFISVAISLLLSFLFFDFYVMQKMVYTKREFSFIFLGFFLLGSTMVSLGQNMLYLSTDSVTLSLFWEKVQHIGLFILYPFWLHFVFYYFYKIRFNLIILITYLLGFISIILSLFTHLLFVTTPTKFKHFYTFSLGPLYSPIVGILFVSILYVFILMILDFIKKPEDRQYKLLIIIASGTTILTGLKDLMETWVKTNIPQLFPYGIILTGIALFFAITLRYREMQKKIEKRKEIEKEALLAQKIQNKFIPSQTKTNTKFYDFIAFSQPALHLSGDFYYKIDLLPKKSFFIIGDICGHGISAALYMSLILSFLEIVKNTHLFHSLPNIADNINKVLFKHAYIDSVFATVLLCEINYARKKITYINAGHTTGLLVHDDKSMTYLKSSHPPIGLKSDTAFKPKTIIYKNTDQLFLFTDGIIEQTNQHLDAFGFQNFKNILLDTEFEKLPNTIKNSLIEFAGKTTLDDDITFLEIRFKS